MRAHGGTNSRVLTTGVLLTVAIAMLAVACSSTTATTSPGTPGTTASAAGGTAGTSTSGTSTPGTSAPGAPAPRSTEPLYPGYSSAVYAEPKHWLCGPTGSLDICGRDLTATEVRADGTTTVLPHPVAADPKIDCFYVYPTISADQTPNSDLEPGATEFTVIASQAARFNEVCRVFAPVYRQNTIASLLGRIESDVPVEERRRIAYADVVDAWHHYLAHDNQGRGVVLMGHSQGAGVLTQLIKDEIDTRPEVRGRVVSALLIGSAIRVPDDQDVGGDFQSIPLCRRMDQLGCAIGFATFRSTAPPPENSLFGKPRGGEGRAACVNPAALTGGPAPLDAYFPTPRAPGAMGAIAPIDSPFITLPGLLTGECVFENGFSYLKVTVHGDPNDPRPDDIAGDLTPEWGLHLVDVNLLIGDMIDLVKAQAAAW